MMGAGERLRRLLGLDRGRASVRKEIKRLGPWFYSFKLGDGLETPLIYDWLAQAHETRFRMILPELDSFFAGRWPEVTCLDVGCNEGYFGFEIAGRGAKAVVGFDARPPNIEKAEFVRKHLGVSNIAFHVGDVGELTPESYGTFDLTLFLGILYHLENPIDALRRLRAVTTQLCVIDTQLLKPGPSVSAIWGPKVEETEDVIGILEEPRCDWNPLASVSRVSLVPNKPALFTMLRHVGFTDVRQLEPHEGCFEQYATGDRAIVLAR
jgi:tRNA (mo5U34)-methyltransferase